ncbi:MAG TPA: tRNA lysidine(34) synthetase TilS [Chitinophagaceae bacterium]|nr:tRNA lysidine(34) synthetase TilS [Chitinophagaceae bacterium]
MNLLQGFQNFIAKENLFLPKDKLLLAVSGGIDSVVLCELCYQSGYDFVIAHCNFQLRGEESNRDEQFVISLGKKYGKQVLLKHFETEQYAEHNKVSIQVAARELRYAWFLGLAGSGESIADSQGPLTIKDLPRPTHIVTAHHLDDNIETVLMNFFKGTGIAGLRGILAKQRKIVRPLLIAKKEDIKKFGEENKLPWVEDSSNKSDKYSRNYFRNQLIPLIKNIYPEAENNLANNLQRFKDIEVLYHQSIDQHKKKLLEYKGNEVHIPVLKLQKAVPLVSIVYEIIKEYHFTADQAEETIALLSSETGRYIQSATHRIIKNRNWLIIAPMNAMEAENILIEGEGKADLGPDFSGWNLELGFIANPEAKFPGVSNIAFLDAEEIKFPLLLRKWKTGDYFYPLGMKKKKKLSRFFIDQKLSKTEKEKIWILEANKKIIWVIGLRIDDRFKVTPSTKKVLRIELKEMLRV